MNFNRIFLMLTLLISLTATGLALAEGAMSKITPSLGTVDVIHNGKAITISRTADKSAKFPAAYAKIGRVCPPFCVQPMQAATGVETIGELEVLGYLKRIANGDRTVMVVDSRTPEWVGRGTIPGSVNIPWDKINLDVEGTFEVAIEAETLENIMTEKFSVKVIDGKRDFRNAKTLVLFCNGIWCPQSSINVKTLTKLGYPAYKLKWYRGGMQDWVSAGLSTTK